MPPLPSIAGRVPVVKQSTFWPDEFWIRSGDYALDENGEWQAFSDTHYWPTEAAARAFIAEVAGREAEVTHEPKGETGCTKPTWMKKPVCNGLYLYADNPADWDLAKPLGVERIEYGTGEVFLRARFDGETRNVDSMSGIWWGPLPTPSYSDRPSHLIPRKAPHAN